MKFVENISEVLWLHWSTKTIAGIVALQGLWLGTPDDWKTGFPLWIPSALGYLTVGAGFLAIFFKTVKQSLPSDKAEPKS